MLLIVFALTAVAFGLPYQRAGAAAQDWTLVRSVPNGQGGPLDFVIVPDQRRRDRQHYGEIANAVCAARSTCTVFFWTDRKLVPTSASMSGSSLTQLTAKYERSPAYGAPVVQLACWLYARSAPGVFSRRCRSLHEQQHVVRVARATA